MAGSVEYRTVLGTSTSIETALRSVDSDIVHLLLEEGFITKEVHHDVINPRSMLNDHQKARELVTGIRNKVELCPQSYHILISHLRQRGKQCKSIVDILENKYYELAEDTSPHSAEVHQHGERNNNHKLFLMFLALVIILIMHATTQHQSHTGQDYKDFAGDMKLKEDRTSTVIPNQRSATHDYQDCRSAYLRGENVSGIYTIKPDEGPAFLVYCNMETDGGGWTVFQRRKDGSVDFFRTWREYEEGFGDLNGEHWLGLLKLHRLSTHAVQELRVDLEDFDGNKCAARYDSFSVAAPGENYRLQVSGYSGAAGNSLAWHSGMQFTTKDRDNDIHRNVNCATVHRGAWWYARCHDSNLNGHYYPGGGHRNYADGVNWYDWKGYQYSLKQTEMKIRSRE